jgi:hypothetical protein
MADHDGLDDGERQSGATGVATGGEERVEYLFPVRFRYRIAVSVHCHLDGCDFIGRIQPYIPGVVTDSVVVIRLASLQGAIYQHNVCTAGSKRSMPALTAAGCVRRRAVLSHLYLRKGTIVPRQARCRDAA